MFVKSVNDPPAKVLEYVIVLILAATVVCMKMANFLARTMILKKIMQITNSSICSFSCCDGFVDQIINLPGQGLTTHTKYATFSQCFEINGTRLLRITGKVYLLGIVK